MKKILTTLALLAWSLTAPAATVDLDTFIVEDLKVGSPDSEAAWVRTQLGNPTADWTVSLHNSRATEIEDFIYEIDFIFEPDYFVLKNATKIALFANDSPDTSTGVFDIRFLSSEFNVEDDTWTISHVTEITAEGGGTTRENPVPEPTTLALLGLGVLALRSRQNRASRN